MPPPDLDRRLTRVEADSDRRQTRVQRKKERLWNLGAYAPCQR
jgi:hypothetical protein